MSDERDDNPGGAQAPADAGAPASGAKWSEVDLSDLDAEQEAAAAAADKGEGDEDEDETESTDEGDDAGDDSSSEEDADENDDGDEGDDDEDGDEEEEPRKKRNRSERYRDRIAKLETEVQTLRGRSAAGQLTDAQIDAKVKAIIGEPPKESDFPGDFLAYDREANAYAADKRQVTRQVKQEAQQAATADQQRNVQRVERHKDRVEEFRTRGSTKEEKAANAKSFDDAMKAAKGVKVAPHVEDLIIDSDKSAHLQLYFAKNPTRLDQLNRMSERDAARAMGGIEARLSVPKPKVKSSAPPPRKTPRGGSQPASEDADLDRYLKSQYGTTLR